ncbi:MAG: adenylate kinase [Chloroflexi bacterium]|nr:adenylate kinase [Chloroflexota bacterium]
MRRGAPRIVLLGPPGAGKGTQAAALAQALGVPHVATGDLFRAAVGQGTALGRQAKSYMDRGELVPDDVTVRMLLDRVSQPDAQNGYVLDGFPRTLEQARALDEALSARRERITQALLIAVPDEELVQRLGGRWICRLCQTPYHAVNNPPKVRGRCDRDGGDLYQRDDDKPETVRQRLRVYAQQTAPLIDYYERQGILLRVNGQQEIEAVRLDLLAALR